MGAQREFELARTSRRSVGGEGRKEVCSIRDRDRERERERERENARSGNKSSDHVSVRGDFR